MITLSAIVCNFLSKSGPETFVRASTTAHGTRVMMANGNEEKLSNRPTVMFVLGGPGAGKGTQCANLVKDYDFEHLSAGDLLRTERNSGSTDGDLIQEYIKEGKIVPIEITIKLLKKAIDMSSRNKFLIDGFPRNKDNLDGWNELMNGKVNLIGVLFFDCPEDVCVKRILKRGETSGRADDNEESLRKRFETFYNDTMPVIEYFRERDLYMSVSAVQEPTEVYQNVRKLLDKRGSF